MELTYRWEGDYLIPNIKMDGQPEGELRKFGLMRRNFLRDYRSGIYTGMLLTNRLTAHLLEIQEQAEERMETLVAQMAAGEGVNEELKARNQMLWVRKMNNIQHSAEEIVLEELIYV
ncbi:MAG: TnpV protein [Roseburia sp.]|nr:TnpV protein [Roseburia sp.]